MKRVQLQRWPGQLLATRTTVAAAGAPAPSPAISMHASIRCLRPSRSSITIRHQSTAASPNLVEDDASLHDHAPEPRITYPSPLPEKALKSAKLAALHARLSLSQKIPLQTLARTLVDRSADPNPSFNNSNLVYLGHSLINHQIAEWLMCRYPRLPMMIMYAALKSYGASAALHDVARQWGVDSAAAPGDEVDPGLLQFSLTSERAVLRKLGFDRPEAKYQFKWRHGITSRVVMDDDFGDIIPGDVDTKPTYRGKDEFTHHLNSMKHDAKLEVARDAHADFVRAVVGAIYAHCGREAVRSFVKAHILSRRLDFERLFYFRLPTRELASLCARENFEPPVARLISETGRLSIAPVFVVGIYSGNDKLGEGAASSLDFARTKAAMNALKAWYLYSPGENVRVPSDMLAEGAKPWEPMYVDIGEVI